MGIATCTLYNTCPTCTLLVSPAWGCFFPDWQPLVSPSVPFNLLWARLKSPSTLQVRIWWGQRLHHGNVTCAEASFAKFFLMVFPTGLVLLFSSLMCAFLGEGESGRLTSGWRLHCLHWGDYSWLTFYLSSTFLTDISHIQPHADTSLSVDRASGTVGYSLYSCFRMWGVIQDKLEKGDHHCKCNLLWDIPKHCLTSELIFISRQCSPPPFAFWFFSRITF